MTSPFLNPVFTLPEYAKGLNDGDRPLVEMFATSSDVMQALPFTKVTTPTYRSYRQSSIPASMNFRAINALSTSGGGTLSAFQELTYPIDHDIPVDKALVERYGPGRRKADEKLAMARLGELWLNTFLKGDNTATPTVFNGLQKRSAQFGRTIDNAQGVLNGAPLSLYMLDQAIWNTRKPTHIIAPWAMMPRFTQAMRNPSITHGWSRIEFLIAAAYREGRPCAQITSKLRLNASTA